MLDRAEIVIKNRRTIVILAIFTSLAIHLGLLSLKGSVVFKKQTVAEDHKFKIDSIRTVGKRNENSKNLVHIPKQTKTDTPDKKQTSKGKDISLSDLQAKLPNVTKASAPKTGAETKEASQTQTPQNRPGELPLNAQREKPIEALSLNNQSVKSFLQNTPNASSSGEYAKAFGQSNVLVELEVPNGVPEDELNKYELVFYSFRKRTALNYVNSFYNELNDFQGSNPHLRFPMTEDQESMTGRITYDEEGNIVRIKMLKWTNKEKLQDFFLHVLKNMNSLPNPPEIIIKDGEFHVYYSLTVNG